MLTLNDVDQYKKGLTDRQKKQWLRIYNSVLKRSIDGGSTEEEGSATAIAQANGVVVVVNKGKEQYSTYKNKQKLAYDVKLTVHQEKAHLVVPVVMMVEGVHNGSLGPIYHSIEELGKFPEAWNGIPVVIYHPEKDGEPVSANSPDVIDSVTVGRVYNTEVDGKKLKAEVWLDEEKLNKVSENTLNEINATKEIEVSLGMFADYEVKEGTWGKEKYFAIAYNHRPDHLAILPDQIGACSCADGCGLGANTDKDMKKNINELINTLSVAGYAVNQIGNHSETGFNEKMSMVYDKLRSLDKEWVDSEQKRHYRYTYLEEMFNDYLVYSISGDNNRKMYKQEYKIESGKIEFVGDPVEVHRKVEYVVNSELTRTKFSINNKQKEDKMSKENKCPKCVEKINALIANKQSGFVEDDREWLNDLTESALDKITPKVIEKEKIVEKTVEVNKLTPEQEADLAFVANQRKERRGKMVTAIIANTEKGTWDEVTLNAMSESVLEKVFKSVKKTEDVVDYSLNGESSLIQNNSTSGSGGILLPPGVNTEVKK